MLCRRSLATTCRQYCTARVDPEAEKLLRKFEAGRQKQERERRDREKTVSKPFGSMVDIHQPRDPVAAKGTVLETVVRDGKLKRSLPDHEHLMFVTNKHPALPDFPETTGEWLMTGKDNPLLKDEVVTSGSGQTIVSARMEAIQKLRKEQEARRVESRSRHRENALKSIAGKLEGDEKESTLAAAKELENARSQPAEVSPSISPTSTGSRLSLPSRALPKVSPPFPVDTYPPLPDSPIPVRLLSDRDKELLEAADERMDKTAEQIYDDAYRRWQATKKIAEQRAGRAVPERLMTDEEREALAARRHKARFARRQEEETGVDPLDELEKEMFPEKFADQAKANADADAAMEEKKKKARVDLKPLPNALTLEIKKSIQLKGPISLAEFMKEANLHPAFGYYTSKKKIFGRDGDFITSPEVSCMFGECLGAWAVDTWHKLGRPKPFWLVELGGGKGTAMARLLKSVAGFDDFADSVRIGMIEISPTLVEAQRETILKECGKDMLDKIRWAPDIEGLPIHDNVGPIIAYCNELFDAFALSKFQYTERGWCEWLVEYDLDPETPEHFKFVLSSAETGGSVSFIPHELRRSVREQRKLGQTLELQMQAYTYLERFLTLLTRHKGALLVIDYGVDDYVEDSLRGIKGHEFVHPLSSPGEVDLSGFVSFKMMRSVVTRSEKLASKIHTSSVMDQAEFLKRVGIEARTIHHLSSATNSRDSSKITREFSTLTNTEDDSGMGKKFKMMCFSTKEPRGLVPPCPW
ncbi:NADH dehydrogenase complex I [Diplonema papillatum]|nr:NADH dehydrogenase complex I [Diplonema papillatum]